MHKNLSIVSGVVACSAVLLAGCSMMSSTGSGTTAPMKPLTLASKVDLPRYMGDWYVIANIPTSVEEGAYNAKESYTLQGDGKVATVFSFNEGNFAGPLKTYHSTGAIVDKESNAIWTQQYIWPIKADYRISFVSPDYRYAVVTREKRDYVWILARTATIPDAEFQRLAAVVTREGYDAGKLRKVPQASGK